MRKETSLKVRIGIHTGDILVKDSDIFGDGVNIASRIEAAGEPGGIYISEKTCDEYKNKSGIRVEFYGEKILKIYRIRFRIYSVSAGNFKSISGQQKPITEIRPAQAKSGIKSGHGFSPGDQPVFMATVIFLAIILLGGYF